jgi:RNA recognition motif-containing protein
MTAKSSTLPNEDDEGSSSVVNWRKSILSILTSSDAQYQVKKLRKNVLLTLQLDDSDKSAKKEFKRTIQELEGDATIQLDSEGMVTLLVKQKKSKDKDKKQKKKKNKESKKTKRTGDDNNSDADEEAFENKSKKHRTEKLDASGDEEQVEEQDNSDHVEDNGEGSETADVVVVTDKNKNKPCKGNPQGVTRLFIGNLPFSVDETSLSDFLPKTATHIKWITDKETGKFYGSAFIEMDTSKAAAEAVAMAGSQFMGRAIKINFAPAREGDVWPPPKKVVSGGGQAGGTGVKAMGPKPDQCVKLFIGNLSYDIDDEGITKFFASVDAEVKAVRWLHHKENGDFKGWYVFVCLRKLEFLRTFFENLYRSVLFLSDTVFGDFQWIR